LITYSVRLNYRYLMAGYFCWANIFVVLLALFHLGYYLPAKLKLIDEIKYVPIDSPASNVAILLFLAAILAFQLGVFSGRRYALGRILSRRRTQPTKITALLLLSAGVPILSISVFLLVVFVFQQGGLRNLLQLNYTGFWNFQTEVDSRFIQTGIQFFPVGILITYIGLLYRGCRDREILCIRVLAGVFILWLLTVGSRGTASLLFLALLYVGHLCKKPLPWKTLAAVGLIGVLTIPVIAVYRNVEAGDRVSAIQRATFVPLAAAVEMGQTYRTLVGFVDFFWQEHYPLMMGRSYWIAAGELVPNLGFQRGTLPNGSYYRSAMWITGMLDPGVAAVSSGGLGSTGVGEPYANFGYLGVIGFFWFVGLVISGLEQYFLLSRSHFALTIICGLFIPINWYIRDDIYGVVRAIVWPIAAISFVFFLYKRRRAVIAMSFPS
jgi:O-antigen polysaccharide polymerase Wzy